MSNTLQITLKGNGEPALDTTFAATFDDSTDEQKAEFLVYQNAVHTGVSAVLAKLGHIMSRARLHQANPNAGIAALLSAIDAADFDV